MIDIKDGLCVFTLSSPQAEWVSVAGDFNGWSPTATPMKQVRPGLWRIELPLPPGDYRFRYVTSHRGWLTDWAAFGVERNGFGEWNSIIHVPASSVPRAPTQAPAEQPVPLTRIKAATGIPRLKAAAASG